MKKAKPRKLNWYHPQWRVRVLIVWIRNCLIQKGIILKLLLNHGLKHFLQPECLTHLCILIMPKRTLMFSPEKRLQFQNSQRRWEFLTFVTLLGNKRIVPFSVFQNCCVYCHARENSFQMNAIESIRRHLMKFRRFLGMWSSVCCFVLLLDVES